MIWFIAFSKWKNRTKDRGQRAKSRVSRKRCGWGGQITKTDGDVVHDMGPIYTELEGKSMRRTTAGLVVCSQICTYGVMTCDPGRSQPSSFSLRHWIQISMVLTSSSQLCQLSDPPVESFQIISYADLEPQGYISRCQLDHARYYVLYFPLVVELTTEAAAFSETSNYTFHRRPKEAPRNSRDKFQVCILD